MTPVEYREANKKGIYLMVVKDNLWQREIGVIYNICYLNRTSVKQCVTYTESVIVKSVTFSDSLVHKSVTLFGTISVSST